MAARLELPAQGAVWLKGEQTTVRAAQVYGAVGGDHRRGLGVPDVVLPAQGPVGTEGVELAVAESVPGPDVHRPVGRDGGGRQNVTGRSEDPGEATVGAYGVEATVLAVLGSRASHVYGAVLRHGRGRRAGPTYAHLPS